MRGPHSHPAHRNIELGRDPVREPSSEFAAAMRVIAETRLASEMKGICPDEFSDALISAARTWVEREDRDQKFISELG